MSEIYKKFRSLLPVCGTKGQRYLWIIFSLSLILFSGWEFKQKGLHLVDWDLLPISALAAIIIFLQFMRQIPEKMNKMLDFLFDRRALEATEEKVDSLKKTITARAEMWSRWVGLIVSFIILTVYLVVYWGQLSVIKIAVTLVATLIGYIGGNFFGQMACYGQLSRLLTKASIRINVVPGHADRAGGLERIGDFYFFQALVLAIPAAFLAIWWLVIPIMERYQGWRDACLGLFILAIVLEFLSFIVPLWAFHKEMKKQRDALIRKADRSCPKINVLMDKLTTKPLPEAKEVLREDWEDMRNFYECINNMSTWPLDDTKRKYFSLGNLTLLAPVIFSWVQKTEIWQRITEFFSKTGVAG